MLSDKISWRQAAPNTDWATRRTPITSARASFIRMPSSNLQRCTCFVRQRLLARPAAGTSGKLGSASHAAPGSTSSAGSASLHSPPSSRQKPAAASAASRAPRRAAGGPPSQAVGAASRKRARSSTRPTPATRDLGQREVATAPASRLLSVATTSSFHCSVQSLSRKMSRPRNASSSCRASAHNWVGSA